MKKFYLLIIAAFLVSSFGLSAQVQPPQFEAVAGLNLTTVDYSGIDFRPSIHIGARATFDIPDVTPGFYVNAAALFTLKGFKVDSVSYSPWFIDIPIHVGYKYDMDDRFALFAETGPYLGIGLFGNKVEGYNIFSDEIGYKRIDLGLGVRLGIEFSHRYSVSIGGDFGFLKVTDDFDAKPRNLLISFGYKL